MKTYTLESVQEDYYVRIKKVTQHILKQQEESLGQFISSYQLFIKALHLEKLRTRQEYALDFILLGSLQMVYGKAAMQLKAWQAEMLKKVNTKRTKAIRLKPVFSYLKGKLSEAFLSIDVQEENINIRNMKQLIEYLEATGEFDEISKRLKLLATFMDQQPETVLETINRQLTQFMKVFKEDAKSELGEYTKGVSRYLDQRAGYYKGREDAVFCRQPELLYHLNMIGAELLNEAYRTAFKQTKVKYIFLPGCMVYQPLKVCKSEKTDKGNRCKGCTMECPVRRTTILAQKYGAKTTIVYHGSALYHAKRDTKKAKAGLIGVACVLNLIEGGLKAITLGYVPQCALLKYCGCKAHWNSDGLVTKVDEDRIEELLNESEQ